MSPRSKGFAIATFAWLAAAAPVAARPQADRSTSAQLAEGDCNNNGVPDEFEDCNNNGLADACDLQSGTSGDCDGNGIPDECDVGPVIILRSGNGIPGESDSKVTMFAGPPNSGFAGIFNPLAFLAARRGPFPFVVAPLDNWIRTVPSDPIAQWVSPLPNADDAAGSALYAINFNWNPPTDELVYLNLSWAVDDRLGDELNAGAYLNEAAIPGGLSGGSHRFTSKVTNIDITNLLLPGPNALYLYGRDLGGPAGILFSATIRAVHDVDPDCNRNGLPDACDLASNDCDANGLPDECDPDCNQNDRPDACDIADGDSYDFDGNGVPDECQPDCNENGFPDFLDIAFGIDFDCNDNQVPDLCDLSDGIEQDCNGNLVPDACDISDGFSGDCNANGLPDDCEADSDGDGFPDPCDQPCDFDHDADVDLLDYAAYTFCLGFSGPAHAPPYFFCRDIYDVQDSHTVDLADFAYLQEVFGP